MTIFFIIVFVIYFLFLLLLIVGWNTLRQPSQSANQHYFLSVIVPFRNEAVNLPTLIQTLSKQNYPVNQFEVILVNDQSTDNSEVVLKKLAQHLPHFKVVTAQAEGKKNAITQAIGICSGEIIATTDADCDLPIDWLKSINQSFQDSKTKMLVGAVRIKSLDAFFSRLQSMEFTSLIGSAGATLALGFPTMCNGANLAYRKESFVRVNGFEGNTQIASGDDEFLMREFVHQFGSESLVFLKEPNAVVTTTPQSSLKDFFKQRIRWAGKWKHNSNLLTKFLAVFVWMFQLSWLIAVASFIFLPVNYTIAVLVVVKVFLEAIFLSRVSKFMKQKFLPASFLVLQIFYPLYVIAVGVASRFVTVSWKDRPI